MMENASFRPLSDPSDPVGQRRGGGESLIHQSCFFEGTFRTPENMRIEGTFQGVIECQGTLLIAESGQVNARIVAGNLIVAGQFSGEVQCESRFELLRSGRASGSIATKTTVIHDGAFFEGDIRMGEGAQPGASALAAASTGGASSLPRPALGGGNPSPRRRGAAEALPSTAESDAPETADSATTPRVNGNGRSGSSGRDVLPNRAADA